MPSLTRRRLRKSLVWIAGSYLLFGTVALAVTLTGNNKAAGDDRERSVAAFAKVASVLRHPRCINCHTATDFPRQGAMGLPHAMNVRRGHDDHGRPAMRCYSCHQNINQHNGVPGAPNWGLAPLSMAWEGLDDHALAEQLKDPKRNGARSLEMLFDHMAHDELVGWGWNPGGSREPVPMPRSEFAQAVREWIDTGAHSPNPSK